MNTESSNAEQLRIAKAAASKRYMSDVVKLNKRAQLARQEYFIAVEHAGGVTGIDYSRDAVSTSVSPDAIPNALIKYDNLRDVAEQLAVIANEAADHALELINGLEDEEAAVLRMKYLLGLTVKEIATGLYVSERTAARRLNDGLVGLYEAGLPVEYRINKEQAA